MQLYYNLNRMQSVNFVTKWMFFPKHLFSVVYAQPLQIFLGFIVCSPIISFTNVVLVFLFVTKRFYVFCYIEAAVAFIWAWFIGALRELV